MKKITFLLVVLFTAATFGQVKWNFDKSHSNVKFSVSHMVVSSVDGDFKNWDGTVETESAEDFTNAKITLNIDVASISTDNEKRDNHLKAPDFFNAKKFPKITFVSKSFQKVEGSSNKYILTGDFTMKGVTKEITLDVKFNGIVKDPWGNTRAGFKLSGEVNRFDYGLKWNKLLEAGGAIVGKDVEIGANVELILAK